MSMGRYAFTNLNHQYVHVSQQAGGECWLVFLREGSGRQKNKMLSLTSHDHKYFFVTEAAACWERMFLK
jgi:hypothetical protein